MELVPTTGFSLTGMKRSPKYVFALSAPYKMGILDYGSEEVALVAIVSISASDHTSLSANADVIALPQDMGGTMTAPQVAGAKTFYNTLSIPSGWINTNRTILQVVKITAGLFQFNQRWRGITSTGGNSPFKAGMTLSTKYKDLSDLNKGRIQVVFDTMSIDISSLTGETLLGEAMQEFAIQISARPLVVGGVEF
jgi:hypothetical protein